MGAPVRRHRPGAAEGVNVMRWLHRLAVSAAVVVPDRRRSTPSSSEELRFHLERQIQANLDAGMTPADARRARICRSATSKGFAKSRASVRSGAMARQIAARRRIRRPAAAKSAGFCDHRHRHRGARHRRGDRDFQRRLWGHPAAAARSGSRTVWWSSGPSAPQLGSWRTFRSTPPTIATGRRPITYSRTSRSCAASPTST